MIPSLLAQDVAKSLRDFIVTGFETDTWPFAGKFEQLVDSQEDGEAFIKGPYVSIDLPFAKNTERRDLFPGFDTEHSPFVHQAQAWGRLRSDGRPKNTIVATGAGSGKTECFLYPLLDHCQRNREPGIKAIVIYPMNALAGDQAKRFAQLIHSADGLKGKIRVGLYVGGGRGEEQTMGEQHVISSNNTLCKDPPDILLTNYKMLDFLLMRPKDRPLWQHNVADTLKYLVVDELHSFDGAQGSDLAMLIRRLRARLNVDKKSLVCVGTSATLGGEEQSEELAQYASEIFGSDFDAGCIIGESRESHEQFLQVIEYITLDPSFELEKLHPSSVKSQEHYLKDRARLFFGEEWKLSPQDMESRQQLGRLLRRHLLTHNLLQACSQGPISLYQLSSAVKKIIPAQLEPKRNENVLAVLVSFLALLSHARGSQYPGEPFVTVRLQLWARELRRIVSRVGTDTTQNPVHLQFSDDLKSRAQDERQGDIYLPVVQCNECHTTAWLTCFELGSDRVEQDLRKIYTRFFAEDREVRVLLPLKHGTTEPPGKGCVRYLCTACGHLQLKKNGCNSCAETELQKVYLPDLEKKVQRGDITRIVSQRLCPVCKVSNSLLLFGARAASLASVAIHQMFANRINDDKKLIAFSDSVQDAAYRAGFFAARTWQNNIRMALTKAITYYCESNDAAIPLAELYNYLQDYWREEEQNPERLGELSYITQFIPPNMHTDSSYVELVKTGELKDSKYLLDAIKKRLTWETLSEFGFRSAIGRSLERTGVATLYWEPELITGAAERLVAVAREQLGYDLSPQSAGYMLWGIVLRMKRQGAIHDKLVDDYIDSGGDDYQLSGKMKARYFMPIIGRYSALPRFPAERAEKNFEQLLPKPRTWYSQWVKQLLDPSQLIDDQAVTDLLKLIMRVLVDCDLLLQTETKKKIKVWALNPEILSVTNKLKAVRLHRGGDAAASGDEADPAASTAAPEDDADPAASAYGSWYLPEQWLEHIRGMPSLDPVVVKDQSPAVYQRNPEPRVSMYRDFYKYGEVKRVISHEHTALLEREEREQLERRFMMAAADRRDWHENLLSATPTLEMGIDIGDLSSVLLCSVPPGQANYLQRAGRGGRRDGNSFVLTLANGHPHDLYFYADPLRMLAGDVAAPAIFLNAVMVLRRQLLAFCFDQWSMKANGQHHIQPRMQSVLNAVKKGNQKSFPYTLLKFIGENRDELWERFEQLLGAEVFAETKRQLKTYFMGNAEDTARSPLAVHVLERMLEMLEQRRGLAEHQKHLENQLTNLLKQPEDGAKRDRQQHLESELQGIKRLKMGLDQKDTLNFLTDEGLLPNYAFPEEGTTLKSVIVHRPSQSGKNAKKPYYDSKVFEYTRPAQAALSELAPESTFYASNRKVKIERVEMARGENLETWRLCPSCSYSKEIGRSDTDTACPKCGDAMWADTCQRIHMVRLKQVYAHTSEQEAFIGDSSETREPTFYNRQMLIDFDPVDIPHAYATNKDGKLFGFEFIKKAKFREINFGRHGVVDPKFEVAGETYSRPGFRLCRECGMVQNGYGQSQHMYRCRFNNPKSSDKTDEQHEAGIVDCLYLYREYESEALRILMPRLSSPQRDTQTQSFVAALQLGLRVHFGGKVDHLHIADNSEPMLNSGVRAYYLVLHDTVPGGTGYLPTLLDDRENLLAMLRKAYAIMKNCECQHNADMDGCYNCLFAYKNSYGMENTSRRMAMSMLEDICKDGVTLEKVDHLGEVEADVNWADSELERLFPDALRKLSGDKSIGGAQVKISKDIVNGKIGFKLEVGEQIYSVEPHARLGPGDGVTYACEPDFLISQDRPDREADRKVRVAVFLDGYDYHRMRIDDDLMKRQGISLGTDMLTWSLTWPDVEAALVGEDSNIPNVLSRNTHKAMKDFIRKVSVAKELQDHEEIAKLSPIQMLMKFLADPNIEKWRGYAMLRTFFWLDNVAMRSVEEAIKFEDRQAHWPDQYTDNFSSKELWFRYSNSLTKKPAELSVYIAGEQATVWEFSADALVLAAEFDPQNSDGELTKAGWQLLLQLMNIGQFLPNFFAGTAEGIANGSFAGLEWGRQVSIIGIDDWDEVAKLADENISAFVGQLASAEVPVPEVGYELVDEGGAGVGQAELVWEDAKVAFMLDYQLAECRDQFENRGWTVVTETEGMDVLIDKLRGQQ